MKIIIVGVGKVGYTLAKTLSGEKNDVVVIDKSLEALEKAEDNLDVLCIKGNGVGANTLFESGINDADLLIAVTGSDEINMVCCLTAKRLGVKHTAARIRDPQYAKELLLLKEQIGIDLIINPEHAAADEIVHLINFSPAINIENFAGGRVKMAGIKITSDMPIIGQKLRDYFNKNQSPILIGAVSRDNKIIIPKGDFEIRDGDIAYIIGKHSSIYNFCKSTGKYSQKYKNAMILGGGRITYYLTVLLTAMGMKVKIIEIDPKKCEELSEVLDDVLIINADGTDEEVLLSENISDMDCFIAVTGVDEENLLSSLMAKQNGVKKVIAKISRISYMNVVDNLSIDNIVNPKLITVNQILKFTRGNNIESLYKIIEGQAEIGEYIIKDSSCITGKPIKSLGLPEGTIIATIVRRNEIVVPKGNDVIKKGDRVIIITKNGNLENLDECSLGLIGGSHNELLNSIKKFGDIISL